MKKYTIATIAKVAPEHHAWFHRMANGVQKFGQETGHHTFLVGPPRADENLQVKMLEDVIAQGVDAICVIPYFPQALEMTLGKARRNGMVVISHEASNQRNVDYDLEAFDNAVYGAHLMDHLARCMGQKGEYTVLLGSLTSQSHSEWTRAALARQEAQYPRMHLATRKIVDHDDPVVAHQRTVALLREHPELKGILGIDMTATAGAGAAITEQQLQESIVVVGTGLVSACRQHLLSGATRIISCWDPSVAGYVMNKLAVMVLEKQDVKADLDLGVKGYEKINLDGKLISGAAMLDVTKENMAAYDF